ncbi:hypothetical protein C5B41_13765 [Acinetobacter ursingii]|uniref:hypothetical protein n=1 Tax=Acinetobacter ursingii TaxID=108980 RepID=UPI000CF24803|nr:hypothetical protein [Acinetobacter ursingii]PPZ93781.1 hypothetical protein C5B41_13765 [Acinetobacter ursingii]
MNKAIYQLNISTPSCMKASLPVSGEVANYLSTRLVKHSLIQRNELLQKLDYPKGVGSQKGSFLDSVYHFANAILAESNSPTFTVQIEAIPAYQKIFYSADDLPIADKPLIVVFKDKDIISAEYCSKHEAWHTQHGNINVHQIHQWAYVDDFYKQLNLPEFPERSKRPDPSELIKGLKGLFEALSDAAVEVHVHKVNSKGNSLKDMFDEIFKEDPDFFKSNTKH